MSPPPFARTTTIVPGPSSTSLAAPAAPVFARRSSPMIAVAGVGSVAPVSLSQRTPEPTVIVVRERARAGWVIGAAAIGAVCALAATRLLGSSSADEQPSTITTTVAAPVAPPAASPPPAAVVVAPVVAPAPRPSATAAVVHFGADQGVAITAAPRPAVRPAAPAPAAPPEPAPVPLAARPATPKPRASAVGPALPDGSFGLGRNDNASTTSAPAPAPAAPAAPTETAKKQRPLTPEQQLAEAQLKASMR